MSRIIPTRPKAMPASISTEMLDLVQECIHHDELRDRVTGMSRLVTQNTTRIIHSLRGLTDSQTVEIEDLVNDNKLKIRQMIDAIQNNPIQRDAFRVSQTIEKFVEACMLDHFFCHGSLASHSQYIEFCNDEEYIAATLGFAQELGRYVVGRACENDLSSIALSREIINTLNGKMLEFDFRNGNLRRKYDGLKYSIKSIEDITFELSLVNDVQVPVVAAVDRDSMDKEALDEQAAKRIRVEDDINKPQSINDDSSSRSSESFSLVDVAGIDLIKERMEKLDKRREDVIKMSRDVQKLAKQSIFSVHRGQVADAMAKLSSARTCAENIMTIVNEYPILRSGAFSSSLEEWAEAAMLIEWVNNKTILTKASTNGLISSHEYIGALSDFTGEIGRLAVALASTRNVKAVEEIYQADAVVASSIMQCNVGGRYNKKVEAVLNNFKKLQDIVYELSLLQRGGKALKRDLEPKSIGEATGADGNPGELE